VTRTHWKCWREHTNFTHLLLIKAINVILKYLSDLKRNLRSFAALLVAYKEMKYRWWLNEASTNLTIIYCLLYTNIIISFIQKSREQVMKKYKEIDAFGYKRNVQYFIDSTHLLFNDFHISTKLLQYIYQYKNSPNMAPLEKVTSLAYCQCIFTMRAFFNWVLRTLISGNYYPFPTWVLFARNSTALMLSTLINIKLR